MQLYPLCLNPLLHKLDEVLAGVRIGRGRAKTVTVAYADDVTVLLTSPDDVLKLQDILHTYEEATGARINTYKSRALDVGGWDTTRQIMNIPYHTEIKILGFKFGNNINIASKATWCSIITQARAAAQDAYYRELSLDMRIQYVHSYLLAKIWYAAQIYPITTDGIRRLNTAIAWFLWRGEIFRVPLSTLQRGRDEGGWKLVNIWAKSRSPFIHRLQAQGQHGSTLTAAWLMKWDIQSGIANPPHPGSIPAAISYLRV